MATLAQVPVVSLDGISSTADPITDVAPPALLEYLQGAVYAVHVAMCAPYVVPVLTVNPAESAGDWHFGIRVNVGSRGLAPWLGYSTNPASQAATGSSYLYSTTGGSAASQATRTDPPTEGARLWPPSTKFELVRGGQAGEQAAPATAIDRVLPLTASLTPYTERCYGSAFHSISGTLYHVSDLRGL